MLKRFISYYKPHKKMFLLDMLASFFISAIGMTYPIITRTMLNDLIPNRNIQMIVVFGVVLFILYFTILSIRIIVP